MPCPLYFTSDFLLSCWCVIAAARGSGNKRKLVCHFASFVVQLQQRSSLLPHHWPHNAPQTFLSTWTPADHWQLTWLFEIWLLHREQLHPHQQHHEKKSHRKRRGQQRAFSVTQQNIEVMLTQWVCFTKHGGSVTLSPHASPLKHPSAARGSSDTLKHVLLPDEESTEHKVTPQQKCKQPCILNISSQQADGGERQTPSGCLWWQKTEQ